VQRSCPPAAAPCGLATRRSPAHGPRFERLLADREGDTALGDLVDGQLRRWLRARRAREHDSAEPRPPRPGPARSNLDFDGNLNARDNWDHAGNAAFPLRAHAYYSVVETSSHWFLIYLFFHPRDWTDSFFDTEHENDAEGVMLAVRRDASTFGRLQAAVTVAHTDFFSYVPAGGAWTSGGESVDGGLQLMTLADGGHPVTAQQAKDHGLKARPDYDIVGDGVIYFPSLTTAEVPSGPDDRHVSYKLVDILTTGGMWDRRANTSLFASFGNFAGDTTGGCGDGALSCSTNSANAPWGWDDHDDGPLRGALATDPAGLVRAYFTIPEAVSTTYTFNPFR